MSHCFNLSLDDFSPRPQTNNLEWCDRLIERCPDVKIDLFVPGAYARLSDKKPFYLTEHPEWVRKANALPENYNICMHGMFHRRKVDGYKKYHNSANDEWEHLSENEALDRMRLMINEFENAGLRYSKVFRPPGWRISLDATRALINNGFIIAGDKNHYNKYKKKIKNLHEHWIAYDWDMTGKCVKEGSILAYGHISSWCNNYFDQERYNMVLDLLESGKFDFRFLEGLV